MSTARDGEAHGGRLVDQVPKIKTGEMEKGEKAHILIRSAT
jgi:hypothetical protein